MILTAIGLLLVAALFGIYMAMRIFKDALPPAFAAIIHGILAASGLVVALYAVWAGAQTLPVVAGASLLVIAALGGFFLLSFHLRKKTGPKPVVVIHALIAVCGVGLLLANVAGLM